MDDSQRAVAVLMLDGPAKGQTYHVPSEVARRGVLKIAKKNRAEGLRKLPDSAERILPLETIAYRVYRFAAGSVQRGPYKIGYVASNNRVSYIEVDYRREIESHLYAQPIRWDQPSILREFDYWWAWQCWKRGVEELSELCGSLLRPLRPRPLRLLEPRWSFGPFVTEPRAVIPRGAVA